MLLRHTPGPCHGEGTRHQCLGNTFPDTKQGIQDGHGYYTTIIIIWIGECNRHKVINSGCGNPCSTLWRGACWQAEGFDGLGKCTLGSGVAQGQCKGSQCCCGLLPLLAFEKKKKREH